MQSLLWSTLRRPGVVSWLRTPSWNVLAPSSVVASPPPLLTPNTSTTTTIRSKHSKTQIKRLFKNHPARIRVHGRLNMMPKVQPPPEPQFAPVVPEVTILSNGWTPPPPSDVTVPEYPFRVARTKNKPMDAVGFLPVYSRMR